MRLSWLKYSNLDQTCLKIPEDVFDQDHSRIDDNAEIDGADGQQVRILAAHDENDDAEEQRKWNIDADDDRAAQVSEKDPLNQKDQDAAEDEIVQYRLVVTETRMVRS